MIAQCPNCGSYVSTTYICKNCQTAFCFECMKRNGAAQLWHDHGRREVAKFKGVGAELGLTQLFGFIQSIVASKPCPSCGTDNAWASKRTRWVFAMLFLGALVFFVGMAADIEGVKYFSGLFFIAASIIGIWPMLTKQLHAQGALKLAIKSGDLRSAIEAGYEYQKAKNMGAEPTKRDVSWILKKTGATIQQYDTVIQNMKTTLESDSSSDQMTERVSDISATEDHVVEMSSRLQDIPISAADSIAKLGNSNALSKQSENLVMMKHVDSDGAFPASGDIKVSGKSRLVVLLVCLFFGVFGVHRFYVGKRMTGIFQLVTLGGLGVWSLLDLVTILFGKFSDSKGAIIKSWR